MRFTIRDLCWLMALVGLGVAWFADHRIVKSEAELWTFRATMAEVTMRADGWIVHWTGAEGQPHFEKIPARDK